MRPHTATTETPHSNEDPPQPKINIKKKTVMILLH